MKERPTALDPHTPAFRLYPGFGADLIWLRAILSCRCAADLPFCCRIAISDVASGKQDTGKPNYRSGVFK